MLHRKQGVDVSLSHERVEVVYTGDTVMDGLVSQPMVWEAGLLIMEVTYLDGDGRAAAKNFHIHVQAREGERDQTTTTRHTKISLMLHV